MPTPPKPFSVLKSEGKSHRTKKELKQRQQGEEALSTGVALRERPSVKNNAVAHKEFKRVNELLKNIGKNDAIYEPVINRYCELQAEISEGKERQEEFKILKQNIKAAFKDLTSDMNVETRAALLIELTDRLAKIEKCINEVDKEIQSKRKMLFDIERDNIMTIASALRSVPKKTENKKNALIEALGGD